MSEFKKLYEEIMNEELIGIIEEKSQITTIDKFFTWYSGTNKWEEYNQIKMTLDDGTVDGVMFLDDTALIDPAIKDFTKNKKKKIKFYTVQTNKGTEINFKLNGTNYMFPSDETEMVEL